VHLGSWISPCYGPFSLGGRFETYEPFISVIFRFFPGCGEPWVTETARTESTDMGTQLHSYSFVIQHTGGIITLTFGCIKRSIGLHIALWT
jgi:hypothetical protein